MMPKDQGESIPSFERPLTEVAPTVRFWLVRDDCRDDPNGRNVAYCGHPGAKGRCRT
jgi:hypothetical protein